MIILAKATGWGLAELIDLDVDDLWVWLETAQGVENEIAKQLRGK